MAGTRKVTVASGRCFCGCDRVALCVDDTDDLSKATSTGSIAEAIAAEAVLHGASIELGITRHQLLISDEIPYTSHNSSMATVLVMDGACIEALRSLACAVIEKLRAPTANPGLCIARIPAKEAYGNEEVQKQLTELIAFGKSAKLRYRAPDEAFDLASRIPWIVLLAEGGNGDGVVGALSGVGLRLSGDDGRFRGKWDLQECCNVTSDITSLPLGLFCERMNSYGDIEVISFDGNPLTPDFKVFLTKEAKPMLCKGKLTFMVRVVDGIAYPCGKDATAKEIKDQECGKGSNEGARRDLRTHRKAGACPFGKEASSAEADVESHRPPNCCNHYTTDNDVEELFGFELGTCSSCLYRRWTTNGFECQRR